MIPSAGSTCKFVFDARFAALDGIYKVMAITTFGNSVASGVDYVANLYTPAGLDSDDFNADYVNYTNDTVVILASVLDSSQIRYVPESLFLKIPDPTIREYLPMVLVADLGVRKNSQVLLPVMGLISDVLRKELGVEHPVRLVSSEQNKIYLTDGEYQTLQDARDAVADKDVPLLVQIEQLKEKLVIANARNDAYEALIIELSSDPTP